MSSCRAVLLLCGVVFLSSDLKAQEVVQCPSQSSPLLERWRWASESGARSVGDKEFWIGYCIKRLMNEDSYINSGNMYHGWTGTRRSLYDIISGNRVTQSPERNAWGYGGRTKIVMVLKDVALLFRVSGRGSDDGAIQSIEISNMELCVDLKNKPLLWLGGADDDQSAHLLTDLFDRLPTADLKKELLTAIGIHQNSKDAFQFLVKILKGDEPEKVRAQAAFWLGQQNNPEGLALLMDAAQKDRSGKVREQSVFAIGQLPSDESTEALIYLARKVNDTKVRAKAAFWLGQKASQKAVATLETIIADDEETDVQRQALFALAQNHTSEGVDRLIKIAGTHPNPRIRKQAIQCLGQSDDPQALDALIAILRK